jgi:hypothetical protein
MVAKEDMVVRRLGIGRRIRSHGTTVLGRRIAEEQVLKSPVGA